MGVNSVMGSLLAAVLAFVIFCTKEEGYLSIVSYKLVQMTDVSSPQRLPMVCSRDV